MMELEKVRAKEAREKREYVDGKSDTHPHGLSGLRFLLPYENGKGCWDTAPKSYRYSEYGIAAGMV